jgi:DNA (cytosine-5)-methyltransferase 1
MSVDKKLTSLSFFSGCLGLDLGLEQAGIHQLLACDNNKFCRQTIAMNRPEMPVLDDINNYDADEIRQIAGLKKGQQPTLVVGGPPCQAFSTAGKRRAFKDPRGNVFLRYIQLIEELQPDFAVIENVRGLLSAALQHKPHCERTGKSIAVSEEELSGSALAYIIKLLGDIGYATSFNLYNSANYGVAQVRERVILIAARDGRRVPYLKPTHSKNGQFGLKKWSTFRESVKGLNESDMTGAEFPAKRLKYFKMLKEGQHWKHLPKELQIEALGASYFSGGGKTGFLRRLAWDKPSPTLVTFPAMPATDLSHPHFNRPLSVQEYKRLQQFPDHWQLAGNIREQYKQLGNAVPVGLGAAIGRALISHLKGTEWNEGDFKEFPYSRYKNTDDISWNMLHKKKLVSLK